MNAVLSLISINHNLGHISLEKLSPSRLQSPLCFLEFILRVSFSLKLFYEAETGDAPAEYLFVSDLLGLWVASITSLLPAWSLSTLEIFTATDVHVLQWSCIHSMICAFFN